MRQLQDLPLALIEGIITKFRPEDTAGNALLLSENADGFGTFRAYGKIPGSEAQVLPAQSGTSWEHLAYFEYISLLGTVQREILGLNGTELYKINTDKSIDSIKAGLVSEPLSDVTTSQRIHFTSTSNTPFKYDGNSATRWGVVAPGLQETVVHPIEDSTGWELVNAADALFDSTASKDAGGALGFDKTNTATNLVGVQTFSGSYDFSSAGGEDGFIWFFVPAGAMDVIRNDDVAFDITVGSGGTGDPLAAYNRYDFNIGDFEEGWNLLSFDLDAPDDTSGTVNLDAVQDIRFRAYTAGVGDTVEGFRVDKLFVTDLGKLAMGTPTTPTGTTSRTVRYKQTFVSKYGQESNGGPTSSGTTTSGTVIPLTNISISSDPQVNRRRLYRDLDGDAQFRFVGEIKDNVTTTFTDDVAFSDLGSTTPPLAGDLDDDNTPPPRMSSAELWNNHIFGVSAESLDQLEILVAAEPESAPITNRLTFPSALTAVIAHNQGLYIFSSDKQWILTGDDISEFVATESNAEVGATNFRAVTNIKGEIVSWHDDGPYLWQVSGGNPWYLANKIKDLIEDLEPATFSNIHIMHDRKRFRVLFFIQSEVDGKYDTILSYNYGHVHAGELTVRGSIDPHDLRQGSWSTVNLPTSVDARCSELVERSSDTPEPWIGTADGNVYFIQKPGVLNYAQTLASGTVPVECVIQTTAFPMSGKTDFEGRPRFVAMNMETTATGTWGLTFETLTDANGAVITSTGINISVGAGVTSPLVSLPINNLHGPFGRITLTNSGIDEDGVIRDLRLKVMPGRFRGPRSQ